VLLVAAPIHVVDHVITIVTRWLASVVAISRCQLVVSIDLLVWKLVNSTLVALTLIAWEIVLLAVPIMQVFHQVWIQLSTVLMQLSSARMANVVTHAITTAMS
jgi:hypothetical protein